MYDKIYIGSDHAGFDLKNRIIKRLADSGYITEDMGTNSPESCDYPLIAHDLCNALENSEKTCPGKTLGILICGTGIGMSIAANRHAAIRAALCDNELQAKLCRMHNNANVLCLGARITGEELAFAIVDAFLNYSFEGGRHLRRINLINSAS